jgi:hypothetical protein
VQKKRLKGECNQKKGSRGSAEKGLKGECRKGIRLPEVKPWQSGAVRGCRGA